MQKGGDLLVGEKRVFPRASIASDQDLEEEQDINKGKGEVIARENG